MAQRVQIQCINKSDRDNPYERIINIGGINGDGSRWKMTQQQAIKNIEDGVYSFFVSRAWNTADVIVAVSQYGHKYIKTKSDGEQPDNLLSLPECP